MKEKLRNLYVLQLVDSHLDDLEELKGDLPSEVNDLEARLGELEKRIEDLEGTMRGAFSSRNEADSEILGLKEKLEKYKQQQYAVRNNREYDALTREMDAATEAISRLEKEMEGLEGKASMARSDIDEAKREVEELDKELKEKRAALAEVSKATEEEELRYSHEREKLATRLGKGDLKAYERIRKAKRGKAVVPVKRGACGGCYNRVPAQRLLELRQNKRIYACERCGRMLVSDEIAETTVDVA
ncbi:MAG: C4-type zinc ribbon domain-containing protein [Bacteroidota bacterium]